MLVVDRPLGAVKVSNKLSHAKRSNDFCDLLVQLELPFYGKVEGCGECHPLLMLEVTQPLCESSLNADEFDRRVKGPR